VGQKPDANAKAEEQNSQVYRVEPELKDVVHYRFSLSIELPVCYPSPG
jgi:hypothetical protein